MRIRRRIVPSPHGSLVEEKNSLLAPEGDIRMRTPFTHLTYIGRLAFAGISVMCLALGAVVADDADPFTPLCRDTPEYKDEIVSHRCWTPVVNQPGCHFWGLLSLVDKTLEVSWSGTCENGRAVGAGVLTDESGNRAEGHFVNGLKHGQWTRSLAKVLSINETHKMGLWDGPWTLTYPQGVRYTGTYVENWRQGVWVHDWPDGYSEVGPFEDDRRHGTWTITWPDGHEAAVPFAKGKINGDVTVTHKGTLLGVLVYRKGERIGRGLPPVLLPDP